MGIFRPGENFSAATATKSIAFFSEKIVKEKMKLQKQPGLWELGRGCMRCSPPQTLWSSHGDGLALIR